MEFGQLADSPDVEHEQPARGGGDGPESGRRSGQAAAKQVVDRSRRRHELLSTLLPPATMFNRSIREMLLGVGSRAQAGPRSLV